jgi:hypothetical protein
LNIKIPLMAADTSYAVGFIVLRGEAEDALCRPLLLDTIERIGGRVIPVMMPTGLALYLMPALYLVLVSR